MQSTFFCTSSILFQYNYLIFALLFGDISSSTLSQIRRWYQACPNRNNCSTWHLQVLNSICVPYGALYEIGLWQKLGKHVHAFVCVCQIFAHLYDSVIVVWMIGGDIYCTKDTSGWRGAEVHLRHCWAILCSRICPGKHGGFTCWATFHTVVKAYHTLLSPPIWQSQVCL